MPNIIKTTHCLAAMSIKDHLIKLTMWWQGAQKLRNDQPGGGGRPPAPPSVSPLPMTQMKKMKMTPTTIYRTSSRTSFFRQRFLSFWTIKLTFITFACKNQYFVVDWSRRVFAGVKVNWPAAYSWITLESRCMAKISAAAYLRMRLISEYIR